ncbi:MAG: polyphosphate kinase 1 [Rhizobacter sp.]|nr:polyphosphate kinase 1 [Chlorobiales bacterium]
MPPEPVAIDLTSDVPNETAEQTELYINRELSWLEFNQRVLEEAGSESHRLLERLKFVAIFHSNLDEFFMIRVAGLEEQYRAGFGELTIDGLSPKQQLAEIRKRIKLQLEQVHHLCYADILPKLHAAGVRILGYEQFTQAQQHKLAKFFDEQIFPVLTPLAIDTGHPFPYVSNLSLSLVVQLKIAGETNGDSGLRFARVKVPDVLPRLCQVDEICGDDDGPETVSYVWLEDIIAHNLAKLFPDMEILETHPFRLTRNADIEIEEDEASDLLETIEKGIRQRRYGAVVRLEITATMPEHIKQMLMENLEITGHHVYTSKSALGLSSLMTLMEVPMSALKDIPFVPHNPFENGENEDLFTQIRQHDILLNHPYDSFEPVIDFIGKAARDPGVLAIKQTLYRVGKNSPIVQALIEAAENGKQVAVLLELKARFDEENNITWAKALEKVGVHVVYGLVGLKTHAKISLVVRREPGGLKRYVHLGTGNYNTASAKVYTDYGLFTCNEEIGADASELFNFLTGYSKQKSYRRLIVAPLNIRSQMLAFISRETLRHQSSGAAGDGRIVMKMNALVDPDIIGALYEASQAGVKIDLIIRGICALRPGLKGLSETIRVISIVGRFLEHSRVFYFHNGGAEEMYLGSADMMQRNLDRRVEILFPLLDAGLKAQVKESLEIMLRDTVKSRTLQPSGIYTPTVIDGGETIDSQTYFLNAKRK